MTDQFNNDEAALLKVLSRLSKLGPVVPQGRGANAVGKTLQHLLGIVHSTTSRNSLFNHTITATASRPNSAGRTNLFACVPDWKTSVYKSSKSLVERFGREDLSRDYSKSLFCTSTTLSPNGFGLILKVVPEKKILEEWFVSEETECPVVSWDVSILEAKLASQGNTAIVTALPVIVDDKRAFHYRYVDLLGPPDLNAFFALIEDGAITIDHCISIKVGKDVAREQGPLFKVRGDSRGELYKDVKRFDLMDL